MANRMRELFDSGKPFYGTFVTMTDAQATEVVALAGYDFAIIDLEHSALSLETVQSHLQAARSRGIGTMIRIPRDSHATILRVLEMGADGIIVSHVKNAADARSIIDASRYAPIGHRGLYDGTRAADFTAHSFPSYKEMTDTFNAEVIVAMLIEDKEGVDNIDDILAVGGMDLVIVGPSDLSYSLGHYGSVGDPEVGEYLGRVERAAAKAGVAWATPPEHGSFPIQPQELVDRGVRFFFRASDIIGMLAGLRERRRVMAEGSTVAADA